MNAKRVIMAGAAFVMVAAAYMLLSSLDRPVAPAPERASRTNIDRFVVRPATQPVNTITEQGVKLNPGDNTRARVYDDVTGRLKYQFEAEKWEPVTESRFHLVKVDIQIYSARGQITFIRADEAEVDLVRNARSGLDPKRGFMKGNVQVIMDRTTTAWREANPDLAASDSHPEQLIRIWLDDARFDMDLAELKSDSSILIDSNEARIENVSGLTLQWNQLDNRIDNLRFDKGGLMKLRRGGRMIDFAMPGTERDARNFADGGGRSRARMPRAEAMRPMSLAGASAAEAAVEIRREAELAVANQPRSIESNAQSGPALRTPEELATALEEIQTEARQGTAGVTTQPDQIRSRSVDGRKKIDTYRAIFANDVVVEQMDGLKTLGRLDADRLEINFDFGSKQREAADAAPKPRRPASAGPAVAARPDATGLAPEDNTRLVLTWNGPLELKPILVDPSQQTGERFDAIATGKTVRVKSEQGNAVCGQLVYRHERRQVWLSGSGERPVELAVSSARRLSAREVFFDQKRGLARIDGPGNMVDTQEREKGQDSPTVVPTAFASAGSLAGGSSKKEPVEIQWTRGVDVEIASRPIERTDPATGERRARQKEYLRRAWFHGDVRIEQGDDRVAGDELAVTFGIPDGADDMTAQIEHVDAAGRVRLESETDLISAEKLNVEMARTADGRSVPRIADATGEVYARQGSLEFRADTMHVVLGHAPADGPPGIETLDASGDVFVQDPETNLKISRTGTLNVLMREGNRLARATVVSPSESTLARVRFKDFAVHGQRVEIDAEAERIDVPGPGKAWMLTRQDFNGRKLRRPTAVKTAWSSEMQMRLAEDYGYFVGQVRSETDTFALDCDRLTIRFMPVPPDEMEEGDGQKRFWFLGAIQKDRASVRQLSDQPLVNTERKRPAHVTADGNAVAISSTYAMTEPGEPVGRLLSRFRLAGDQIVADLRREELWLPGTGSLLIEDYQMNPGQASAIRQASGTGPLMSSFSQDGPSQTAISWKNSMKFFVDQNFVDFDREVQMVHRSGQQMVLQKELAEAMRLDEKSIRLSEGRRAALTCGHLIVEFVSENQERPSMMAGEPLRATDVRRLVAKDAVHLEEGTKSLMGEELTYLADQQEITLLGSSRLEARIFDQDEKGQSANMWKGPRLRWNRITNRIESPGASIRSGRR